MTVSNWDLPAGSLICFSTGEYSDYGYSGHFVVLQDIKPSDAHEVKEEVLALPDDYSMHESFIAGMIRRGFLASVNVHEIHIGSYGSLDIL